MALLSCGGMVMNMGQRIKKLRKGNMSQSELAKLVGVSVDSIRRWESNKRPPSSINLLALAEALDSSVAYFVGETEDPSYGTILCDKIEPGVNLNIKIIRNDKKYSTNDIAANHKLELPIEEKANVSLDGKFLGIPLLTIATTASFGTDNSLYEAIPQSTEYIFVEANAFQCIDKTRKPFAVPMEGDSMIGAGLCEGAYAVINPAEEISSGDTALVCCDGARMIKWIVFNPDGSIELAPANPNYNSRRIETVYASDPTWFQVIGKVVRVVNISRPKRAF